MLIDHLELLFPGVPFGGFQLLLKIELLVIFLLIRRSLYTFWIRVLCCVYVLHISIANELAFSLLVVSFEEQSFSFKGVQFINVCHYG